ncbi:MAG: hypothetical protein ACUVRL_03375 [Candidatus Saccharicenans sp.]|uniref:hypothetical protein n=1 Tax=Candidatus Saccharicenans sp. TaxID=2819258 RepID=UPI00404A271C
MKKIIMITTLLLASLFLTTVLFGAGDRDDYQVIKKAVQDSPRVEPVKEVKWFKVLVTDNRTGKEKVKITMPIALVEIFARCADNKEVKMSNGCSLNLEQLLAELKKAGPLAIIEVQEEDEMVKVWLE